MSLILRDEQTDPEDLEDIDEDAGLRRKALQVEDNYDEDEDDGDFSTAKDGHEFLRKAIKEARKCDDVTRAENLDEIRAKSRKVQTVFAPETAASKVEKSSGTADGRNQKVPTVKWQCEREAEFSSVRMKLERYSALRASGKIPSDQSKKPKFPDLKDEKGWCKFCYGPSVWTFIDSVRNSEGNSEVQKEVFAALKCDEGNSNPIPVMSLVTFLRPSQVVKLLEYQIDWCETIGEIPLTNPGLDFGPWIYGLLALVQKPMDPDTSYAMRTLAALAKKQRSNSDEDIASRLSLFICIVARYFGQRDLADGE